MKILLINLPSEGEVRDYSTPDYLIKDFIKYPPLGLMSIASEINPEHEVKLIDVYNNKLSIQEILNEVRVYSPKVIGISTVTRRLCSFVEITKAVKKIDPEIQIVAGGPHVNIYPEDTIKLGSVDYVLPGFAEKTFPLLIEFISEQANPAVLDDISGLIYFKNNEIVINPRSEDPISLDDFKFPRLDIININDYCTAADNEAVMTMCSSRGCTYRCIYCDVQEKKLHFKSAAKVVDEMEEIVNKGIKQIHFFDDNFSLIKQRVVDICNEILKRGLKVKWTARCRVAPFDHEMGKLMKAAGCVRLHVGVESLDDSVLEYINKGITVLEIKKFFDIAKKLKIKTLAYFMVGFSAESAQYRRDLIKIIKKEIDPTYIFINIVGAFPKTQYYNMLLQDGVFKTNFWDDFAKNPIKDFQMPFHGSMQELSYLKNLVYEHHRTFFFAPKFILMESLNSLNSPAYFINKCKTGISLIMAKKKIAKQD